MNTAQAPCEAGKRKQSTLHETLSHGAGYNHTVIFTKDRRVTCGEIIISHLPWKPHWQKNRLIRNISSQRIEASLDLIT